MPNRYQYPFSLDQLAAFSAVAARLHFREAARELSIAQPALSRKIRILEEALGTELFARTRRRVELTAAGRALLEAAVPALEGLLRVPERVRAAAEGEAGVLQIRFTGLAMATVLPGIVRAFSATHPNVRIELTESPTSRQIEALADGSTDLGFFHPDTIPAGIGTRLLMRERNGVVLPASHPLARRRKLALSDLSGTPFVLFPRDHNPPFHDRILRTFEEAGVRPRIADEVWPRANAIGLVRAGLGATFMTPSESRLLPDDVAFRALTGPAPESRLVLGWRDPVTPVVAAFLREMRKTKGDD